MQILAKSALATLFFSTLVLAQSPVNGTKEETTGKQGDAKPYHDNPPDKAYWADFSGTKLQGGLKFFPDNENGGNGVRVEVVLSKLPSELGPWSYHVHDQPVPADGNCTGTKAHLDPFIRGQKPECDKARLASCEVGDLSGKHGGISADIQNGTYQHSYNDHYITLLQGEGSYIGNRSIVVHSSDGKRYACANITELALPGYNNEGSRFAPGYWGCGLGVAVGLKMMLV